MGGQWFATTEIAGVVNMENYVISSILVPPVSDANRHSSPLFPSSLLSALTPLIPLLTQCSAAWHLAADMLPYIIHLYTHYSS